MAKKNNYLIYGDDDREQVENIDEIAKGLDELIEKEREKQIKKRTKKKGKNKATKKNNVNYVTPVREELLDINDDIGVEVAEESPDNTKKKPEKKEEKKKSNWSIYVLTGCLAIILASIGTVLYNRMRQPQIPTEPNTEEVVEVVEKPSPVVSGRLVPYNEIDGDDVNASLLAASNINSVIESYYRDFIEVAKNYRDGDIITQSVNDYKQLIDYDITSLNTYSDLFTKHDGKTYFDTSNKRFENLRGMLDSYVEGVDRTTLYTVANNFIRKENSLNAEARQALIYYLDRNGIYYNDDSQHIITYEELSISGDTPTTEETVVNNENKETLEIEGDIEEAEVTQTAEGVNVVGTWKGNLKSELVIKEDGTCEFNDGGKDKSSGTWEVDADNVLRINVEGIKFEVFAELSTKNANEFVMKADSKKWKNETFKREKE